MSLPPLIQFLLTEGRSLPDPTSFAAALGQRLADAGMPVWRINLNLPQLNPELAGYQVQWREDWSEPEEWRVAYDIRQSEVYFGSPVYKVQHTGQAVRVRLEDPAAAAAYPVTLELQAAGGTDYLLMPMDTGGLQLATIGFTTRRPGGFTEAEVETLRSLVTPAALVVEVLLGRALAADLLRIYVGEMAAERILKGQIIRGEGDRIHAVVFLCDMRDFSTHMEVLSRTDLGLLMRDYFDCMVGAVLDSGGDVLKFMGDGILAIYPAETEDELPVACARALIGAEKAVRALDTCNAARRAEGRAEADVGIALHVGDMFYGNIGARTKLDFTVMGPAVNRVARIERLCAPIGERILTSREFRDLSPVALKPVGAYPLKGLDGLFPVYAALLDARALDSDTALTPVA